ncbi:MAG: hypothetical protein NXI30_26410 [bacterium]|nr:hypothetical protein [bacterium]
MHIKRFEAPSLPEALAQVRAELGPDALILGSRTIHRGWDRFGLLSRSVVEVQAARERGDARPLETPLDSAPVAPDLRALVEPGEARSEAERAASVAVTNDRLARFEAEMRSELRSVHRAIEALGRALGPSERGALSPTDEAGLDLARRRLEIAGLAPSTREHLISGFQHACEDTPGVGLERFVRTSIESRLAPPRPLEPGQVRMLVGAPGVGKTTTLAKLAARNEEGERDVTLVSLDHYRVGASDPLRRYAALLESPFVEASSATEIARLPARRAGHEVLVDTAGRGREDESRLVSLEPLRDRLGAALRVELVVDATARPEILRAQLDRFASLRPDRIVFTRTDECESLRPVVDLLLDPHCPPASWLGTGQRVPEDFEPAESGPMVRSLFGAAA